MPRRLPPLAILILACVLVYLPVVGHPFFFLDDENNIFANPNLLPLSGANLLRIWTEPYLGLYIPVTYTLWGVQAGVAGWLGGGNGALDPGVFHLVSVLVHLGNAWLVFVILKELKLAEAAAVLGALVFALHPMQVEAVAWASGFKDLGSGCFSLLAIRQYLRVQATANSARPASRGYLLLLAYFLLALLAKPGSVAVLLILLPLGYWHFGRRPGQLARELWPLFLMAMLAVAVTRLVQPVRSDFFLPNPWQRLVVAGDALAYYGYKLLWPWTVVIDYGRSPRTVLALKSGYLHAGLAYLTAAIILLRGRPPWRLGFSLFLAGLLPVLGFIPFHFQNVSTVADRYLYLAMLGPAWGMGWLFARTRSRLGRWGLFLLVLLLAGRAMFQVGSWRDSFTVCAKTLAANPDSWLARGGRGLAWAEQRHYEEAIADYRQALERIPPQDKVLLATSEGNLGSAYLALKRYSEAELAFRRALGHNPNDASAHFNLGLIRNELHDPGGAAAYFAKTIELNPRFEAAYMTLCDMYRQLGRAAEAEAVYRRVLAGGSPPRRAEAATRLGEMAQEGGDSGAARGHFRQAIELWPNYAEPYNRLSILALGQGRYEEAVAYGEQALALGWDDPVQQRALAPYRRR